MELCVEHIAPGWQTRPFTEADIPAILKRCRGNHACYRHMGMEPTAGNLREVFTALPRGRDRGTARWWRSGRWGKETGDRRKCIEKRRPVSRRSRPPLLSIW